MKGNGGGDGAHHGRPRQHQRNQDARRATLRLIERHAAQLMRTARRYAVSVEDAEDAYQRAIEIMLTKAPDIPDAELVPWLKTVVRHEAFALRRKDGRIAFATQSRLGDAPDVDDFVSPSPEPAEQAEKSERLRLAAEALNGLKPQEAQALKLLAQGYSYAQICEETGWTYTKVNRCLAEGRQSFVRRVAGIESGAECERLAPKLSAFADGEAPAADVTVLRRHLRGCLGCQADLREHQLAPAAVAALTPPPLDQVWWPLDRLGELATAAKVKLDSLIRFATEAASSPTQFAVSGGARGLVSPGLAKALTIVCLGGAGAGGVAAVEGVIDPHGPASARAATDAKELNRPHATPPKSPDRRLMAERLSAPEPSTSDDRTEDGSEKASGKKVPFGRTERRPTTLGAPSEGRHVRPKVGREPVTSSVSNTPRSERNDRGEASEPSENDFSCSRERNERDGRAGNRPTDEHEQGDAEYAGGIDAAVTPTQERGDAEYAGGIDAFRGAKKDEQPQEASEPSVCA